MGLLVASGVLIGPNMMKPGQSKPDQANQPTDHSTNPYVEDSLAEWPTDWLGTLKLLINDMHWKLEFNPSIILLMRRLDGQI